MLTIEDLLKLRNTNLKIDAVNKRLDSLGHMFIDYSDMKKIIPKYAGFDYDDSIDITTVFQSEDVSITLGIYHKKDVPYPTHCHNESVEYLICIKGSFSVSFNDKTQILNRGDCLAVELGVPHVCVALEDESELFGICIPPEQAYVQCEEKA